MSKKRMERFGYNKSPRLNEEDEDSDSDVKDNEMIEDFPKLMAVSTRKVHKMTDLLVNAKLGIALSDNRVWAEGLLVFYEIFRFLEIAMANLRSKNEVFNRFSKILSGIERTQPFEEDLKQYYGENYLESTAYEIRPSVLKYLRHLKYLEEREPLRLIPYIYHLYLGLLSGGQILKRKRDIQRKLLTVGGIVGANTIPEHKRDAVTRFDDGRTISHIKKEIKYVMNDIANDLSNDERQSLLDEGIQVFKLNLEVIKSIKDTGKTAFLNLLKFLFIVLISISVILIIIFYFMSSSTFS